MAKGWSWGQYILMCALNSGLNPSGYSNDAIPKEENNSDNELDKKPPAVEEPYTNITQEMKTKTAEFAMLKFSTAPEPVFGKKLCDGQILHAMVRIDGTSSASASEKE
jgi:hypothetical protein